MSATEELEESITSATSKPLSEKFDVAFQDQLAAYFCCDHGFADRTHDLLSADQFQDVATATVFSIAEEYYQTYGQIPGRVILGKLVKDKIVSGAIRSDLKEDVVAKLKFVLKAELTDTEYMIDEVSTFARNNALDEALFAAIELKEKGDFDGVKRVMEKAMLVGAADAGVGYDYFERVTNRSQRRREELTGVKIPTGITTGVKALDGLLYHKGWGRKEMVAFMGGPKAGKSTALGFFATNAVMAGFNALYVSLEVSDEIIADRLDANLASVAMSELTTSLNTVETTIRAKASSAGRFMIHQFPADNYKPSDLRRLLEMYKAKGIQFDMIVVDYADIMAPDFRTTDPIANSKSVWTGLRSIAMEYNAAMLTATQTNREGAGAATAGMTHIAEDFNKVRIADLLISINKSEQEKADGEARLFFAASRNQRGDVMVKIKQNIETMTFIKDVIDIS